MKDGCVKCGGHYGRDVGRWFRRGLCDPCWWQVTRHGDIEDYPRKNRRGWEVLEDYEFIKKHNGGTLQEIADRMGMKKSSLQTALNRQGVSTRV